jgi:phosphoserine phosphatase
MDFTAVLVAADQNLSAGHLADFQALAEKNGIMVTGAPDWLDTHKAADIPLAQNIDLEIMQALRAHFDSEKIDVFCTRTSGRKREMLIADMDSTIVTSETLDELAGEAGLKGKISAITEKAMRGELDFIGALKERVSLLEGLPRDALQRTLDSTEISPGAETMVKTMRDNGAFCALVSGGFTFFTGSIAARLGFTAHHGNVLEIKDDKLTGKVQEPILDKNAKLNYLKLYCDELDIHISNTVAIGDGANDLPMLAAAGLGIGYHPKPILEEQLLNCIRHTDLTSVLYIQGYKDIAA